MAEKSGNPRQPLQQPTARGHSIAMPLGKQVALKRGAERTQRGERLRQIARLGLHPAIAKLAQQQHLVGEQRGRPAACGGRMADRIEQSAQRIVEAGIGIAVSAVIHKIAAAGSGSFSHGARLVTSSTLPKGSWLAERARISASTLLPGITTGRSRRPCPPAT